MQCLSSSATALPCGYGRAYFFPVLSKISITAYALFCYFSFRAGKKDYCYPTVKTISRDLHIHEQTITKHCKELRKAGLIHVEKCAAATGKYARNRYNLRNPHNTQRPVTEFAYGTMSTAMLHAELPVEAKGLFGYLLSLARTRNDIRIQRRNVMKDLSISSPTLRRYLRILEAHGFLGTMSERDPNGCTYLHIIFCCGCEKSSVEKIPGVKQKTLSLPRLSSRPTNTRSRVRELDLNRAVKAGRIPDDITDPQIALQMQAEIEKHRRKRQEDRPSELSRKEMERYIIERRFIHDAWRENPRQRFTLCALFFSDPKDQQILYRLLSFDQSEENYKHLQRLISAHGYAETIDYLRKAIRDIESKIYAYNEKIRNPLAYRKVLLEKVLQMASDRPDETLLMTDEDGRVYFPTKYEDFLRCPQMIRFAGTIRALPGDTFRRVRDEYQRLPDKSQATVMLKHQNLWEFYPATYETFLQIYVFGSERSDKRFSDRLSSLFRKNKAVYEAAPQQVLRDELWGGKLSFLTEM